MPNPNDTENKPEKVDIYLDVDHVWQEDPEHNIPENERRTICAVACMKMILDYVDQAKYQQHSLHRMVAEMQSQGAQNENKYWIHSRQVNYFSSLRLVSWRRNWKAPSTDVAWFADNEGYDDTQLAAAAKQTQSEKIDGTPRAKMIESLKASIQDNIPVIVSVISGFSINKHDHQIVVNGYTHDGEQEWIYYTDPALPPETHQDRQKMSVDKFFEYSRYLAIFVQKS